MDDFQSKKELRYSAAGYFLVTFLAIFILSFFVLFFMEKQIRTAQFNALKTSEASVVDLENAFINREMGTIISDLHFLKHIHNESLSRSDDYAQVAKIWAEFSTHRQIYDQIRFIDVEGNELVRVNYIDGIGQITPQSQLQNKKDRNYFKESIILADESVYISPLDLNVERGQVEVPYKPMLRFVMPVYDVNGQVKGVVLLNYLAEKTLGSFKRLARSSAGELVLLNSDGFWLTNEDSDLEWQFMFGEKEAVSFKLKYPSEWAEIVAKDGQIVTQNGLFTFEAVNLEQSLQTHGRVAGEQSLAQSGGNWFVVSSVSRSGAQAGVFVDQTWPLVGAVLKKNSFYFLMIFAISLLLAFSLYINRRTYARIKYYSEYDMLTKVLNRRAGLTRLNALIPSDERRQYLLSLCFLDVNGLKQVNDQLGHPFGDELIKTVVNVIKAAIREQDFIIRMGGDEFLIVLSGIDAEDAERVWDRIKQAFDQINSEEERPYMVSVSHGIISHKAQQKSQMDDLIKLADEKMYKEKNIIKTDFKVLK